MFEKWMLLRSTYGGVSPVFNGFVVDRKSLSQWAARPPHTLDPTINTVPSHLDFSVTLNVFT